MPKLSSKSLKMRALSQLAARACSNNDGPESEASNSLIADTNTDINEDTVMEEAPQYISWSSKAQKAASRFSHSGPYSARHEKRRLKQKNREMAKGSLSILSFFKPSSSSTVRGDLHSQLSDNENEEVESMRLSDPM